MSFAIDVSLLLYASDAGSPQHAKARALLDRAAAGPELLCFGWVTLMSYLRMAHPKLFAQPLSHREAVDFLTVRDPLAG